jgi:hypothetical protein
MKALRSLFEGRRPVDQGALDRVIQAPLPENATSTPLDVALPVTRETTQTLGHVFFVSFVAVLGWYYGYAFPTGVALLVLIAGIAMAIAAALLSGGLNPYRRLHVSEVGITADQLFGSVVIRWWDVRAVDVKGDLSRIMISAPPPRMVLSLDSLDESRRGAIVTALRARLMPDHDVRAWQQSRINPAVASNVIGVVGTLLLGSSFYLGARTNYALGARCSGPSAYLSRRFDVPRQPGCVFIRVSGATRRAGIRRGDQMIAMDGVPVTSGPQWDALFNAHKGSGFVFRVVRAGTRAVEDVNVSFGASEPAEASPDDPITHFLNAKSDLGRHPGMNILEYSKAIELAPDFDLAYAGRAQEYRSIGDLARATADYRKAIELDPQFAEALNGLAAVLAEPRLPAPDEAIRSIEAALASDGCDVRIHDTNTDCARDLTTFAFILLRNNDGRGAIQRATAALRFDPTHIWADVQLAWGYVAIGDVQRAKDALALYRASVHPDPQVIRELQTAIAAPSVP